MASTVVPGRAEPPPETDGGGATNNSAGGGGSALGVALMAWLPMLPGVLGLATVTIYLLIGPPQQPPAQASEGLLNTIASFLPAQPAISSIVLGALLALSAWLLAAFFTRWTADPARANPGMYYEQESRYRLINARLSTLDAGGALTIEQQGVVRQAREMRGLLARVFDSPHNLRARRGSQWLSGTGYVSTWQVIHRAEEQLLLVAPIERLISAALVDRGRLDGSRIAGRDELLRQSAAALAILGKCARLVLGGKEPTADAECEPLGREVLASIRQTINEYRDDRSNGLVFLRRRAVQTLVFTGLTGYVALTLALLAGAPRSAIVAGSAFYLVGALIGLFQAAYAEQRRRSAIDDYGLSTTRLVLSPLVAGIAAVAGVALTAFLAAPPVGLGLLGGENAAQALGEIFDLEAYSLGLIVAAIFGLTPGLLLQRVRALGDQLKLDIEKSEAGGGDTSAPSDES